MKWITSGSAVALAALVFSACGVQDRAVEAVTPLPAADLEELATYQCVTSNLAEQARDVFATGGSGYAEAEARYERARAPFNQAVSDLARAVERDSEVDLEALDARLAEARSEQEQLENLVAREAGFGFGMESLLALAAPYAKRWAQDFVEERLRSYAANRLRQQLLLPSFADARGECEVEQPE